ncbi:MAG TPA: DUF6786 family protein [Phycisphaerae bacterium]|nr:DUF6786 family protein [Phycisphaerae bacterium]
MKIKELIDALSQAGLRPFTFCSPDGGSFVVTPHGARILGLFPSANGDNTYFVNPELPDAARVQQYLAGEHVLGGDRPWIAPERGLFFRGDRLEDGVTTQRSIDPGNWIIAEKTATSVRLVNDFAVTFFRIPHSTVRGRVERSIRAIRSPFADFPVLMPAGGGNVAFAGYEIASRFELLESPTDDLYFGLWFLIQLVVPHGGFLYVPTAGQTVTTDYYEPTGPDYLRITASHVRFKLDSIRRHKIGIRKTEALGRMAFLSNPFPDGAATLVVRNFLNDPSGHYADVPLHTPSGTQDSIQSYNHNSGPGGFGEMEFHTPGINRAMPEPVVTDTNQVWAFRGARHDLVAIAAKLLNLPPETFAS